MTAGPLARGEGETRRPPATGRATVARSPGKLILIGEHAAVYGRPAVVAAVGREVEVSVTPTAGSTVDLELVSLDHRDRTGWSELAATAGAARRAWEAYRDDPTPERFAALGSDDPGRVVRLALGEVKRYCAGRGADRVASGAEGAAPLGPEGWPGATVRVRSDLPVGSGMGSSAAVAVATVAAALAFAGRAADREVVDRLTLEVERRQHGLPSGIDQATVLAGGVLVVRRGADGLGVRPLEAAAGELGRFEIFDSGTPAESTGAVVAAVRRRRDLEGSAFEARLEAMAASTERFAAALARGDAGEAIGREIGAYQRHLEALGVVPEEVAAAVRRVEAMGLAAKVSGAGALTGRGAGCLLVYRPPGTGDPSAALSGYRRLEAALGAGGLSVEAAA